MKKQRTPNKKNSYLPLQLSPSKKKQQKYDTDYYYDKCIKILKQQLIEQNTKWLIDHKISSFSTKNQKCLHIIHLTTHILQLMIVQNETNEKYLIRLINHFKHDIKKIEQFCRCLKHFQKKDYQFQYIASIAKLQNIQPISFYLKCRICIYDSFLNKNKKQMIVNIYGNQQQWFDVVKKVFNNTEEIQIIYLYTDTIKYHYVNIKKSPNQLLNGAQIWRICQIMYRQLKSTDKNISKYYELQQKVQYTIRTQNAKDNQSDNQQQQSSKEKQKLKDVKKLFQKSIFQGLEAQDRELIRILSYKDNNIARMLQKKHDKMIESIAQNVESMRKSIQQQKKKYIQLWNEKQQILKTVQTLNYFTVTYISNDSIENQQRLIKAIEAFNTKYKCNSESVFHLKKLRQSKKNKRLIGIIQNQQRQKK